MTDQLVRSTLAALADTGRVCTPLRHNQRSGLYNLLNALTGMPTGDMSLVGERDLVTMYDAACVDVTRGKVIADKIAAKYQPNPLLDPVTFKPSGTPAPAPAPRPPVAPPTADMSQYAKRRDLEQLRQDLNVDHRARFADVKRDLTGEYKQLQTNLTETLLKVTEALPDVVKGHTDQAIRTHIPGLVAEALKQMTPVTLSVVTAKDAPPTPLGMVHRKTPIIISMLAANVNVYLHGPAGSGKTTVGRKCAEAFGLPFYFAAKVESEYMLLGFKDARGETVRTQFREAYEHGGVFLFDELDGSSPSAVVALNAALANGICPFPDGVIVRHANFKCIAAGNTKLTGATREYVGRNQLDAASVDRFAFVEFGYDDALETALATNANWCLYVQSARKAVASRALKHLVTPRATFDGCKLLEAGLSWSEVEAAVLWKGLDGETVQQLKQAMDVKAPKPVEIL